MYHLAEVRWQQGRRDQAVTLAQQSLEIMEAQVGGCTGMMLCVAMVGLRWKRAERQELGPAVVGRLPACPARHAATCLPAPPATPPLACLPRPPRLR